jgi:aminopeptidase N
MSDAVVHRGDYRPPAFLVDEVDLLFRLEPDATLVTAQLRLRRNPAGEAALPLRLDGEAIELVALRRDGRALDPASYRVDATGLTLFDPPAAFALEIVTRLDPAANTALSGLYVSGGNFYTQCEAEGFRRITFFPDRPDVMARYTTTLVADRARFPVLLSNGNCVDQGAAEGGRHWVKWHDPHPKPCYLFAVVAGDLVAVRDHFVTCSGRRVALAIWVRRGDEDKCGHAMHCLKSAMAWDERVFGREYDLDVFNIAAVSDFNMGAMENKGLNIFNTRYVLARPDTASDTDYRGIETVISHEYFHNWTGNRITCRDWFQLSLKEGLTVFRDQEFSADQGSRAVQRIADVRRLRAAQFSEDAGPLAHPVRPDSYQKIDNFYTATVYQKGAEVVRMIHTRLGAAGFRAGMDRYFAQCDNQAVTIEDFLAALGEGAGVDLTPFLKWYEEAGTPEITAEESYDAASRSFTLRLRQYIPPTPGQTEKAPLPIPIRLGLLDAETGQPLALCLAGEAASLERVLLLDEAEQEWRFTGLARRPVPALLRGFSAPVKLRGQDRARLRFLATHDPDPFLRWDCLQRDATETLLEAAAAWRSGSNLGLDAGLIAAFAAQLEQAEADPAFAAEALTLPSETQLGEEMAEIDVEALHAAREAARVAIGRALAVPLAATYERLRATAKAALDGRAMGERALKNICLSYLMAAEGDRAIGRAMTQFDTAPTMTDRLAALALLAMTESAAREAALARFYEAWRGDDLVLDKWFAIQAGVAAATTLGHVQALARLADFTLRNPNRVRALIGTFSQANPLAFHDPSGAGYELLARTVIALDAANPQLASRLVTAFGLWRRFPEARREMMRETLATLAHHPGLSANTGEMVRKMFTAAG